jgi:hypothetical protein
MLPWPIRCIRLWRITDVMQPSGCDQGVTVTTECRRDPFRETTHGLHMQPAPSELRGVQLGNLTRPTDQVTDHLDSLCLEAGDG